MGIEILKWVLIVLTIFTLPAFIWTLVTTLRGFGKEKPLKAIDNVQHRFAVVICARNEENVIGNLLKSIHQQTYQGGHQIFVVADNCTDNTAGVAEEHGAIVFQRFNDKLRGKGYALHFGLEKLLEKYKDDYDAVCVFDADNLADEDFLTEMNYALNTGASAGYGYRDSKNTHDSWVSEVSSLYWLMLMRFFHFPRYATGRSAVVGGTGFAFKLSALDEGGWKTYSITEDIEFSIQQILKGNRIAPVRKAVFYDEQPTKYKDSTNQRLRWMIGHLQCLPIYLPKILKKVFKGPDRLQGLDMLCYIFFIPMTGLAIPMNVLNIFFMALTPGLQPFAPWVVLGTVIVALVFAYIVAYASARLGGKDVRPMRRAILIYPFFMLTMMFLALRSLLYPKVEWVPIAHSSSNTIEDIKRTKKNKVQANTD